MPDWRTHAEEAAELRKRADEAEWERLDFDAADRLRAWADNLMEWPDELVVPF